MLSFSCMQVNLFANVEGHSWNVLWLTSCWLVRVRYDRYLSVITVECQELICEL